MEDPVSDYTYSTDSYYYRFNFCQFISIYNCSLVSGSSSCEPVNTFAARSNSDLIFNTTQLDSDDVSVTALTSDLPYTFDTEDIAATDSEPIHMKFSLDTTDACEVDPSQTYAW